MPVGDIPVAEPLDRCPEYPRPVREPEQVALSPDDSAPLIRTVIPSPEGAMG